MRRMNTAAVLKTIRAGGPLSRPDIVRATGLSKPTVTEVAEWLLEAGYVHEEGPGPDGALRRPGRPARRLAFRAELGKVLGIDVGAEKAVALVADLSGRIVARHQRRIAADARDGGDALLTELHATAEGALAGAGQLHAVVVGTPGVVEPGTGRITLAPQLPGWEGMELGARLGSDFPCAVHVANETDLSLLGERWKGAARDVEHALFVQVGVGVGAAILAGGDLYRGARGAAGEIGYLNAVGEREAPEHGSGPFEWAVGGRAYARLGRRAAAGRRGALLRELAGGDPARVTARVVFAAAAQGDRAAIAIVDELVGRLARGIVDAATLLDPELVIVGGGISNAGAGLLEPLRRGVVEHSPLPPRVVLSELGDDAVALGAVRCAVDMAEKHLLTFPS
jgi:predicted NBD/HSP70 family sugar kinase